MATKNSIVQHIEKNERPVFSIRKISYWVGLSAEERMVLITIRQHMRERNSMAGSKGWAKVPDTQIATDTRWSIKKVRRIVSGLQKQKVLEKIADNAKGPGRSSRYAMHLQNYCFKNKSHGM